jgi:hypothetical protein
VLPYVAPLLTVVVIWWTWGAVNPLPVIHDEASYHLQADIFAHLRWAAPAPPVPQFFEQPYVLVVPVTASMFPPGHTLLLSLGAMLHFPPLVPLLNAAISAVLIVLIVRRITNVRVALVSWLVWLGTPLVLRYAPGYFSETTTTTMLLLSWWSLLKWRETRVLRWLVVVAMALAWGAITRPITMLAYGIPVLAIVIRDASGLRLWRHAAIAGAAGACVLAIIPLWSARTLGDARAIPLLRYTRDYIPFNKPGFTADTTPPRRALSPVMRSIYDDFLAHHKRHTLANVPRIAAARLVAITHDLWAGAQLLLVPFFVIGLYTMPRALRFAAGGAVLLFLTYLTYAYDAPWSLYYLELTPVVATITACGIASAARRIRRHDVDDVRARGGADVALMLSAAVIAALALPSVSQWRARHREINGIRASFEAALRSLPSARSVVFLRYAHRPHHVALVFNYPDLAERSVWVVHDLGARNAELLARAPGRAAYVFDEERHTLTRY